MKAAKFHARNEGAASSGTSSPSGAGSTRSATSAPTRRGRDGTPRPFVSGDGKVDPYQFITGRIGLDDIAEGGFRQLVEPREENVRILVSPTA